MLTRNDCSYFEDCIADFNCKQDSYIFYFDDYNILHRATYYPFFIGVDFTSDSAITDISIRHLDQLVFMLFSGIKHHVFN